MAPTPRNNTKPADIFDEIEDFEINIRNVSGPGPLAGGALDPNHGLLIGDNGDLNGAAESLAAVVADVRHRTDNGRLPDTLANPADQALVVKFLESIDFKTVPFVSLTTRRAGGQLYGAFDSVAGGSYVVEAKPTLTTPWAAVGASITGNGQRIEIPVSLALASQFLRLVAGP